MHFFVHRSPNARLKRFWRSRIYFNMATVQRKVGVTDYRVYTVVLATKLAFGIESGFRFQQDRLHPHLQRCFEQRRIP